MRAYTKTQREVLEAMIAGVKAGTWTDVSRPMIGITVMHKVTEPTPDYVTRDMWPGQTYDRLVHLTFVGSKVLLRVSPAQWVASSESAVPYWLALAILADPELGHDSARQLEMRRARRQANNTGQALIGDQR